MDDLIDRAMGAFVSDDPRRAAEVALSLLLAHQSAASGSVYKHGGSDLDLWVSRGIDQVDLRRVGATWDDAAESIRAGHTYAEDEFTLVPIVSDDGRGELVGVIYVGDRRPLEVDAGAVATLAPLFLRAMKSHSEPERESFDRYLQNVSVEQLERAQLRAQLEKYEWNLSLVARMRKLSRPTLYKRMRKLGIERQRIYKTARARERD